MHLITQGAEAHLYKTTYLSSSTPAALKIRPTKPYRHPILDRRLTRARVLQEARCLVRLVREGVNVPAVLAVDWDINNNTNNNHSGAGGDVDEGVRGNGAWILMEWIEGCVVRVVIQRWERYIKARCASGSGSGVGEEEKKVKGLLRRVGAAVGALHKAGVVHGDLTTSNLILRGAEEPAAEGDGEGEGVSPDMQGEVVLIDFGLASQSIQDEDRAVDLYVLERAFGSTHPRTEPLFGEVLEGYRASYRGSGSVLKRLEDVRMRGRKRSMIG
ncbi:serine/threonine protein kinase BUD32 [Aspergillus vadensis CBS 113365]|uniref:EKC/KEOPS complex subunit BUD32 n=1 Tax=Aspergillus vadensis (strain CBS 113365 / IMI 142717 / IBT 24658) TaxID=1448311 RepID=A0A319B9X7_ASPVC|nr:kinase-like protein [Aspergillus vadensis CBS 113365]PYH69179.1 kinase-like protein [Aspergillus vadensis CBS 113365]